MGLELITASIWNDRKWCQLIIICNPDHNGFIFDISWTWGLLSDQWISESPNGISKYSNKSIKLNIGTTEIITRIEREIVYAHKQNKWYKYRFEVTSDNKKSDWKDEGSM